MVPKEVIEEIKNRLDIVEVVSEYINLERVGRYYRALCPFHTETRPSFYVSPELQRYKCFGCGASGDAIKFVQEMENISFYEALEKLARRVGIDISRYRSEGSEYFKYTSFLKELSKEYVRAFWENDDARAYMKGRGFSDDEIREFEIGYSPVGSDIPKIVADRLSLSIEDISRFGVVSLSKEGVRDIFEGRIVFPIKNESGDVIAFGGRVIGNGEPKYINSRDTKYFSKSRVLFLLNRAKKVIKSVDVAIVVEGYMDAFALHRSDLKNSVAVLGTSLTSQHASRLSGLTRNIVLAFDNDDAGARAVLRSLSTLLPRGFDILVVKWPRKDADDTLSSLGRDGIEEAIENAVPYESFLVENIAKNFDLSKASGLEKFARSIGEWASKIERFSSSVRAKSLIEKAAEFSGLSPKDMERFVRGEPLEYGETRKFGPEDEVLFIFFNNEDLRDEILSIDRDLFSERFREILSLYEREGDLNRALEKVSNEIGDWVFEVLKDLPHSGDPRKVLDDAIKRLEIAKLKKRLGEVDRMINDSDESERKVLLKVRMDIVRKIKTLERGVNFGERKNGGKGYRSKNRKKG